MEHDAASFSLTNGDEVSSWSDTYPKLVVFAPVGGSAAGLIKAGVLHSAIIPRNAPPLEEDEVLDDSIEAQFDQDYEVLSAQ